METLASPSHLKQEIQADVFTSTCPSRLTIVRSIFRAALCDLNAKFEEKYGKTITPEFCVEAVESLAFMRTQMDKKAFEGYFKLVLVALFKKCEHKLELVHALSNYFEESKSKFSNFRDDEILTRDVVIALVMPDLTPTNLQLVIKLIQLSGLSNISQIISFFVEKLSLKSLDCDLPALADFFCKLKESVPEFTTISAISVMNGTCRLYVWTALAHTFAHEFARMAAPDVVSKFRIELRTSQKPITTRVKLELSDGPQMSSVRFDPIVFEKSLDFLDVILFKYFFPHKLIKEAEKFYQSFENKTCQTIEDRSISELKNSKSFELRHFAYRVAVYGINSVISKELKDRSNKMSNTNFMRLLKLTAQFYGLEVSEGHHDQQKTKTSIKDEKVCTIKAINCLEESRDCLKKMADLDKTNSYSERLAQLDQILNELRQIDTSSQTKITQRRRKELELNH